MKYLYLLAALMFATPTFATHDGIFIRGDANDDDSVNISDMTYISNWLYDGGPAPANMDAADANDDGAVNISDWGYLNNYLFSSGSAPPAPFPAEGPDLTGDNLQNVTSPVSHSNYDLEVEGVYTYNRESTDAWELYDINELTFGDGGEAETIHGWPTAKCGETYLEQNFSVYWDFESDPAPPSATAWVNGFIWMSLGIEWKTVFFNYQNPCASYSCADAGGNTMFLSINSAKVLLLDNSVPNVKTAWIDLEVYTSNNEDQTISYTLKSKTGGGCEFVRGDEPSDELTEILQLDNGDIALGGLGSAPNNYKVAGLMVDFSHVWTPIQESDDISGYETLITSVELLEASRTWMDPEQNPGNQ
jgi:hypothetical protein